MVRRIVTELRPWPLDELGILAALEWQAQEFSKRTEIECVLDVDAGEIALDKKLTTAIFRIFQETLTNIARHSGASQVHVKLENRPDAIILTVRDNGLGITESHISDTKSLGLIGMRERASAWGGTVSIRGVPEEGTTVTVNIPKEKEGERQK